MSHITPTLASPSAPGTQINRLPCPPRCSLANHGHQRGKTGRSLSSGDIRTTKISLLAPFYSVLNGYASQRTRYKSLGHASTLRSQPSVAPSHRSSRRPSVASGSGAPSFGGPKTRPCVILETKASTATVYLMGTFEGTYIDDLHPLFQRHVAILFSPDCTYQVERIAKCNPAHMHSTPEWCQEDSEKLQYIVPLKHDIDLHDVKDRWEVRRTRDGRSRRSIGGDGPEGYIMDDQNLADLEFHAANKYEDLLMDCQRRAFRHELRRVLKEKGKTGSSRSSPNDPNRSQPSVQTRHSRSPSDALEPIPETPTTPSYTRPSESAPDKARDSWISTRKFSVSSASSQTTASKRRSVYDDECPRTPKAAKQEFDTSSTHSRGPKRLLPFMKSPKANTSQPSLPSFASQNQYAVLA
ncbi:hypothetical protein EV715DRAFT_208201 [Schizophyllum commune]